MAWRYAKSAARGAISQLFSSDVALVPHLDLRPNGFSIAKGGFLSSLCLEALSCARVTNSML